MTLTCLHELRQDIPILLLLLVRREAGDECPYNAAGKFPQKNNFPSCEIVFP